MSIDLGVKVGRAPVASEQKIGIVKYEASATAKQGKGRAKKDAVIAVRTMAIESLCPNGTDYFIPSIAVGRRPDIALDCIENHPGATCKATLFLDPGKIICVKFK